MRYIFRADGGTQTGLGHVMRSLALARYIHAQGEEVYFLTNASSQGVFQDLGIMPRILTATTGSAEDLHYTQALLTSESWVVLDGYSFGPAYQQALRASGAHVLVIDDNHEQSHYCADILVNQNLHAPLLTYRVDTVCHRLLGSDYVLLRPEFLQVRQAHRQVQLHTPSQVLLSLGGGDAQNLTLALLQGLEDIPEMLVLTVLVGATNPHLASLQAFQQISRHALQIEVNSSCVPDWMNWADIGVMAGGSTCWESCFMGLPGVLWTLADNQSRIAQSLHDRQLMYAFGEYTPAKLLPFRKKIRELLQLPSVLQEYIGRLQSLVDGRGAQRVYTVMQKVVAEKNNEK